MKKKTVLLVDDDPDFLEANRLALEGGGFLVCTADTAEDALKLARRVRPEAAVLDVVMDAPDSGFALARKLREGSSTQSARIILLTALNELNREKGIIYEFSDRDRDERWLPVDRILNKPIKPQKLVAVVRELIGGP